MLIRFSEQTINNFLIPSFTIDKGEIVIIQLFGGAFFYPEVAEISKILTGKIINENVEISSPFKFVEYFKENAFNYYFRPTTIGRYHKKYTNMANPIYKKIYDIPWITPQIRVNTLAGNPRKRLSLYTTLSWTNNIIFDLGGVDPLGGEEIFEFVKSTVKDAAQQSFLTIVTNFKMIVQRL